METVENENAPMKIPKRIFIVPYRNRVQQKFFFSKYMTFILENYDDYEIYFSHQCDARNFNRGATKNIGFLAMKQKYPDDYKNITFIFNDVDTIPFNKIFDYETTEGVVKHYYGFKYALGGIVVMKGSDFEKTNGFPCFWGWGMEDNVLQKRCEAVGLKIDRSHFYNIGSPEILQLFDGISRIISKKDPWRGENDNGIDGLMTISNLKYSVSDKSENPNDNIFTVNNERIYFINIATFLTYIQFGSEEYYDYDLREPKRKIIHPDKIKETRKTVINTTDWSNIPYYPTNREKRENLLKYLLLTNKPVSQKLLEDIENDYKLLSQAKNSEEVSNTFDINNYLKEMIDWKDNILETNQQDKFLSYYAQTQRNNHPPPPAQPHHQPHHQPPHQNQRVPHKYSPQYAQYVGQPPRAQASARIRLGGAF